MRLLLAAAAALALNGIAVAQAPGGHDNHQSGMAGMGGQAFQLPADPRTEIAVPPDVREFLRFEMRGHLEQLSVLMARLGEGDMKAAAEFARSGLGVMGNHPPGAPNPQQFVPPEFRMMGQAMHKAATAVAEAATAADAQPSVANYQAVMGAAANLTAACAGCHGSFRLK